MQCIQIDNMEIMINDKSGEVIEEIFESFLSRYQICLEESTEGLDFTFIMFIHCISNVTK